MRHARLSDGFLKKYRGVEITVTSDGVFSARSALDYERAETLKELERKIDRLLRKQKIPVAIPVSQLNMVLHVPKYGAPRWICGSGVRHLVLTGLHSNGNVYARDEATGETEQLQRHGDIVRRLTDEEIEEFLRLKRAKSEADAAMFAFERRVKVDSPETLVRRAREAAAGDAATSEPPIPEPTEDPR